MIYVAIAINLLTGQLIMQFKLLELHNVLLQHVYVLMTKLVQKLACQVIDL